MMWKRTGITVLPRKLTRCALSALTTRLAWIFSLGVGSGVPHRENFGATAGVSWAKRASTLAVAVAKQAQADDIRNSRRFTTYLRSWLHSSCWTCEPGPTTQATDRCHTARTITQPFIHLPLPTYVLPL